jgi:cystathionine beta-lyase/cystathionine gamma-synthase
MPRTATTWPAECCDGMLGVRLSIGLEDPRDLIDDLATGFLAMEHG